MHIVFRKLVNMMMKGNCKLVKETTQIKVEVAIWISIGYLDSFV